MFKVKKDRTWLQPWRRLAGNRYRFIRLAEQITENFSEFEVWITFQRTLLDDPDILLAGNHERPGQKEGTVKVEEPCWLLCRSIVRDSDWPGYFSRRYFEDFSGADWTLNNLLNGGNRFDRILDVIDWVKEGEPFAVLQLKKIGPEQRFLITVVKEFRKAHIPDLVEAEVEGSEDIGDLLYG